MIGNGNGIMKMMMGDEIWWGMGEMVGVGQWSDEEDCGFGEYLRIELMDLFLVCLLLLLLLLLLLPQNSCM